MGNKPRRRFAAGTTLSVSALAWVAVAVFAGTPAEAHHGTPIGKTATGQAPTPTPTAAPVLGLLSSLLTPPTTAAPAAQPAQAAATTQSISGTLDVGSSGDQVKMVEQRLDSLHYFVGSVDSTYDDDTYQAVMAFQKANNLSRTGKVDQSVWTAMQSPQDPPVLVPNGGPHRVEINLDRQILTLYRDGKLNKIIAIASGTSATPTPRGDFAVYSKSTGWETSPLGRLYNSQYFVGGYAIHGSLSVPAQPASHGCVRIPMTAADWFPGQVLIGTPVYVR